MQYLPCIAVLVNGQPNFSTQPQHYPNAPSIPKALVQPGNSQCAASDCMLQNSMAISQCTYVGCQTMLLLLASPGCQQEQHMLLGSQPMHA
jgi:hypothetical protein